MPYQNVRGEISGAWNGTVGLPELQKDLRKKEVWQLLLLQSPALKHHIHNRFPAVLERASIGEHLHLAVGCRVYPNWSSSMPHWDLVRTGAGSAEALDGKKLGLEADRLVGIVRG